MCAATSRRMIWASQLRSPAVLISLLACACWSPSSSPDSPEGRGHAGRADRPRVPAGPDAGKTPDAAADAGKGDAAADAGKAHDAAIESATDTGTTAEAGDASVPGFWQALTNEPEFYPFAPL